MRPIVATVWAGCAPTLVSAESITASAPSKTALATSETSARVGRRSEIIESSIWVATMGRIVEAAETGAGRVQAPEWAAEDCGDAAFGDAIAAAACEVGRRLAAAALCCFTRTGDTALRLARQRSPLPLLAFTHDDEVRARLAFSWGVESAVLAPAAAAESMPGEVRRALLSMGACHPGDVVVVVSGSRSGVPGYTDSVRVLRVE